MVKIKTKIPVKDTGVSVLELLNLLPGDCLDAIASELQVDKWVKKLPAKALFTLVLYSLLDSERLSLRLMEGNFKDPLFRALVPAVSADTVTWTGIRERLMQVKASYFKRLYEEAYQQAHRLYGKKKLAGYHIKRYDSTMIATFSHLLQGMKVGNTSKGKTQIKLTTEFTDEFFIQIRFHKDQAHLSEETALKEAIISQKHDADDIVVFDKGLKSRKTFTQLDKDGTQFVTRLPQAPRYELLRPICQDSSLYDTEELEFVQDSIVQLYQGGHELCPTEFRLIQYRVKESGEVLSFLTNMQDIAAQIIAQIYRLRWDIEVLFRFMKQEMNLTHFVCNDQNAIQVMLYCTLITSTLVLLYKKQNNIKSYKHAKIQFFKELLYFVLLEILEQPDSKEWFKHALIHAILKE